MFGYIRACKPEMRIKEYDLYKSVYCSLCKELGKSYGVFARFTLSYDFTFLALLSMSLNENCCGLRKGVCTCNPLKKCTYLECFDELKMPTAAAMILNYYKLVDNLRDEKGIKQIGYRLLKPIFSSAYKKARSGYPEIEKIVSDYIKNQLDLEANNCDDIDIAAEPTAICMSQIFSMLSSDQIQKRCLERMGYSIGRYIYILDAAVDLNDDVKFSRYNPFKSYKNDSEFVNGIIKPTLNISIAEAAKALELIDIKKFKNILDNLIYLGLEDTYKKELKI